jgi:hypothetical protein
LFVDRNNHLVQLNYDENKPHDDDEYLDVIDMLLYTNTNKKKKI